MLSFIVKLAAFFENHGLWFEFEAPSMPLIANLDTVFFCPFFVSYESSDNSLLERTSVRRIPLVIVYILACALKALGMVRLRIVFDLDNTYVDSDTRLSIRITSSTRQTEDLNNEIPTL